MKPTTPADSTSPDTENESTQTEPICWFPWPQQSQSQRTQLSLLYQASSASSTAECNNEEAWEPIAIGGAARVQTSCVDTPLMINSAGSSEDVDDDDDEYHRPLVANLRPVFDHPSVLQNNDRLSTSPYFSLRKRRRTQPDRPQQPSLAEVRVDDKERRPRRPGWKILRHYVRTGSRFRPRRHRSLMIPADHPLKFLWDVLTVLLSFVYAYVTHSAIRDRKFGFEKVRIFCDAWFILDMMLNFVSERQIRHGVVLRDYRSVCARYLTTWFVIDLLALVPAEVLYTQPIIERQNRRSRWLKYFFRTKAVVNVTTALRSRHVQLFSKVARQTKRAGMGGAYRLLRLLIKYVPKYLLFFRTMKGIVAIRFLRQFQVLRRFCFNTTAFLYGSTASRIREYRQQRRQRLLERLMRPQQNNLLDDAAKNVVRDDDHTHSTTDVYIELNDDDGSFLNDCGDMSNRSDTANHEGEEENDLLNTRMMFSDSWDGVDDSCFDDSECDTSRYRDDQADTENDGDFPAEGEDYDDDGDPY
jgi:hypothetical protein